MPNDHVVTTYTPVVVNGVVTFNQSNSLTSHFYKVEPNLDLERRREVLKPGVDAKSAFVRMQPTLRRN